MSTHPFIPLYVDDFEAATAHLSLEEDGVYNRLMRLCWRTPGCSIPADEVWIARKIRLSPEDFDRIARPVLSEFFGMSRGRYFQKRLREEYDDISRKISARKEAGKRGGSAKAAKTKGNSSSNAMILLQDTRAFPEPEPKPDPYKEPPMVPQGTPTLSLLPEEPSRPDEVQTAFDLWNETATMCGLAKAIDLDDRRRAAIRKRLKQSGLTGWKAALDAVRASAFCLGQVKAQEGRKPFKATLDFVCQASSFQKLREGFYGADAKPALVIAANAAPLTQEQIWEKRVSKFKDGGPWPIDWGNSPGRHECEVPVHILVKYGFKTPAEIAEMNANVTIFPTERRAF